MAPQGFGGARAEESALALLAPVLNKPHARNDRARVQATIDQVRNRSRPGEAPAK